MADKYLNLAGATYLIGKVKALLIGKVDKVDGKGLSTNDYTTDEKNKLSGIDAGANKTVTMTGATASAAGKEGSVPAPALGGALFMVLCDLVARVLFSPFEIPVGIVLSFAGAPFFLWLLFRQRGGRV